jgi:hypothetical protein
MIVIKLVFWSLLFLALVTMMAGPCVSGLSFI